jgi:putative DNA primase/helicase
LASEKRQAAARPQGLGEAALAYARSGVPVFPVWGPTEEGGCACPDGLDCSRAAKHPVGAFVPNGLKNATTDPQTIRAWWGRYPDANIGMPTGRRSGILVVDVDLDKGGFESLAALIHRYKEWPDTPTVRTGGGGLHFFFRYPADSEIRSDVGEKMGSGIDVRGERGYVLLPPSVHAKRRVYEWAGDANG